MGTRNRKILRDILARKGRTFLVSMAIFVGVAGTIALFSMGDILIRQLNKDINPAEIAMVNVLVTVNLGAQLDNQAYLNRLRNIEEVTAVQGSSQATVYFKEQPEAVNFHEGTIIAYSQPFDQLEIEPLRLVEGVFPTRNEVVVEQRFADKYGVGVGDTLTFRVLSRSRDPQRFLQLNTHEVWRISGIVFHPYVLSPANSMYATLEDANYLSGTRGYNVFSVRYTDYEIAHRQARTLTEFISSNTSYFPIFTQRQDPAYNPLTVGAQRLSETLSTLALISLFVSGFLVVNVISSILGEQRRQIGTMKALGATRFDIARIYVGVALMYGVLGVIPGVLVGVPLGYWLANMLASQVNTLLDGFSISLRAIGIGVGCGLAIPVITALPPILGATRISILEAMSDAGIKSRYQYTPLARIIDALPLPRMLRFTLRNLSLKKTRITLTVITLAVAVGAFMGILAVFNSIHQELDDFFEQFKGDFTISPDLANNSDLVIAFLEASIEQETGIEVDLDQGFQLPVEIEGYETPIELDDVSGVVAYAYEVGQTPLNLQILEGELLRAEDDGTGIIITNRLANQLDKDVGDTLTMNVVGNSRDFEIVGISDSPVEQVWMSWQTLIQAAGYEDYLPALDNYLTTVSIEGYNSGTVRAIGLTPAQRNLLDLDLSAYLDENEWGVVISEQMAQTQGYQEGDVLVLHHAENSYAFPIAGIFTPPPGLFNQQDVIALPSEALASLEGRSLEDLPLQETYFLSANEDISVEQISTILLQMDELFRENGIPAKLFNFVSLLDTLSQNLRTFQAILSAVALMIGVVGALGLFSTLSMSVYERQREIGVMRSVGATSSMVALQFLLEGIAVGLMAWLVGLPLSYWLSQIILDVTGLDETIGTIFSVQAALTGLAGVLIITCIASLSPALAASRRTVSDILRYQ